MPLELLVYFEHSVEFDLLSIDVLLLCCVSSSFVDMFAIDHVYPIVYNVAPFHFVIIHALINLEKRGNYLDLKNKKDNIYPRKLLFRLKNIRTR